MSRYKYKKTYDRNSRLAYCVGLIASDGSLSKSGRHIDFTTIDYDLAETYRSCLHSRAKIGTKKNSYMYYRDDLPYLKRKKQKLDSYFASGAPS